MKFSNEYLDLWGRPASLTQEELAFFWDTVACVKAALGVDVEICNRDHERAFSGKSKNANGCFYTSDPKKPSEDCFITIDNYFIHECYQEKFHGELNLSFQTLEEVICHEIAHMTKFRHGKGHTRLTEELFGKVQAYQNERNRKAEEMKMENTNERIEKIYDGEEGVIYSVELAPERFVDVKACPGGLVYVMENGDGSMVYGTGGPDKDTYPDFVFSEGAVVRLVNEVHQKGKEEGALARMILAAAREGSEGRTVDVNRYFAGNERG